MIASPYTTPWMPGRMWPSSACSVSASGIKMAEPITGPQKIPTPPNRATISACAETSAPKTVCGVTTSRIIAYNPPAAAAMPALSIIANIFQRMALMPAASAAG